jgi:hypothetical protein
MCWRDRSCVRERKREREITCVINILLLFEGVCERERE